MLASCAIDNGCIIILRAVQIAKIDRLHTFGTARGPGVAKIDILKTFGKTYVRQTERQTDRQTDRKNCTAKSLGLGLAQARPNYQVTPAFKTVNLLIPVNLQAGLCSQESCERLEVASYHPRPPDEPNPDKLSIALEPESVQDITESLRIAQSEADDKIQELETLNCQTKDSLRATEEAQAKESKRAQNALSTGK